MLMVWFPLWLLSREEIELIRTIDLFALPFSVGGTEEQKGHAARQRHESKKAWSLLALLPPLKDRSHFLCSPVPDLVSISSFGSPAWSRFRYSPLFVMSCVSIGGSEVSMRNPEGTNHRSGYYSHFLSDGQGRRMDLVCTAFG